MICEKPSKGFFSQIHPRCCRQVDLFCFLLPEKKPLPMSEMHRREEQQVKCTERRSSKKNGLFLETKGGNRNRYRQSAETETERGAARRLFTKQNVIESLSCWGPFAKPRESWTDSFFQTKMIDLVSDSGYSIVFIIFTEKIIQSQSLVSIYVECS